MGGCESSMMARGRSNHACMLPGGRHSELLPAAECSGRAGLAVLVGLVERPGRHGVRAVRGVHHFLREIPAAGAWVLPRLT